MLFGVPQAVKSFFRPVVVETSKPIRRALPVMVLALLLAPHRRCLKTLAGMVLGHREHVATISRRLRNRLWKTLDWYTRLFAGLLAATDRWERRAARGQRRQWMVVIDTTYHGTLSECMENLLHMSRRRSANRRSTGQHAFVMGLLLTDKGGRLPLPRKSYYTQDYCRKKRRKYRSLNDLAAAMIRDVPTPDDVEVTVVYDSAFDAKQVHAASRGRGFREVFPLDPNRNLSAGTEVEAEGVPGQKVVRWTRTWTRDEFALLELQVKNEDHVFFRRRHRDNLRLRKTQRRYAAAARRATVSKLGDCLVVASYKENPKVKLAAGESADWWACHTGPVPYDGHRRPQPKRWQAKVLACTDPTVTGRQVVEWYEVRWQIEIFFRELKSRMQLCGYVLMKFEAVERYLDLLLMGFLLLEQQRLQDMQSSGPPSERGGEDWVQARTTDRLRSLEALCDEWNAGVIERRMRTPTGRKRLLKELRQRTLRVA
ncbi:MAG TPA: transposase [Candidatus Binatia bacterium]|nr:transposase [Candidatus Binatia bacterium]